MPSICIAYTSHLQAIILISQPHHYTVLERLARWSSIKTANQPLRVRFRPRRSTDLPSSFLPAFGPSFPTIRFGPTRKCKCGSEAQLARCAPGHARLQRRALRLVVFFSPPAIPIKLHPPQGSIFRHIWFDTPLSARGHLVRSSPAFVVTSTSPPL